MKRETFDPSLIIERFSKNDADVKEDVKFA